MHTSNLVELAISLTLEIWLLGLLIKRGIQRKFSVFFIFTIYAAGTTAARLLTSPHYRTYFFVFWWTEAFLFLLSLAALHEVFHWVFRGFYRLWWFRVFYYGSIAGVLILTVVNALLHPQVQAHPVISTILNVSIAIDFIQAGIVALFYILRKFLMVEFRRHAYGIV